MCCRCGGHCWEHLGTELTTAPCWGQVHLSSTPLTVPLCLCPTHERSQGSQHSGAARYTPLLAEALSGMLRGLISVVSQSTPWVLPL